MCCVCLHSVKFCSNLSDTLYNEVPWMFRTLKFPLHALNTDFACCRVLVFTYVASLFFLFHRKRLLQTPQTTLRMLTSTESESFFYIACFFVFGRAIPVHTHFRVKNIRHGCTNAKTEPRICKIIWFCRSIIRISQTRKMFTQIFKPADLTAAVKK